MLKIGCHLSSSNGYLAMGKEAISIGANTFQFFTRNPRGGAIKPINMEDINNFLAFSKENNLQTLLAHAPYTLNACSKDEKTRDFAYRAMSEDIERMELIPNNLYNFHPGSHVGQGIDVGIEFISGLLNRVLTKDMTTTVLLETMAGKGSEVGSRFEELKRIIDLTEHNEHLGVCLDTCHVSDAGYDIIGNLDGVLDEFDRVIGLDRLCAIHLNDSKNPPESHKDRHEKIGEGFLGAKTFENVINHPKLKELPFLLETPNEIDGYAKEIALLKELYK